MDYAQAERAAYDLGNLRSVGAHRYQPALNEAGAVPPRMKRKLASGQFVRVRTL